MKAQGIEELTEQLDSEIENQENILDRKIQENILDRKIQMNQTDQYIEIELTYEVLEEIGTKEKIVF